jgi:hypothetical protein
MTPHEDISEMKVRVALLEAAHLDSSSKISTLINGFNTLNVNLATLISSINTAVKTTLTGVSLVVILIGGFWGYNAFITDQIQNITTLSYQIQDNK